jgi:hypothetical protein
MKRVFIFNDIINHHISSVMKHAKRRKTKKKKSTKRKRGGGLDGRRIRAVGKFLNDQKSTIVSGLKNTKLVSRGLSALAATGKLGAATPYVSRVANMAAQKGFGLNLATRSGSGMYRRGMHGIRHRAM